MIQVSESGWQKDDEPIRWSSESDGRYDLPYVAPREHEVPPEHRQSRAALGGLSFTDSTPVADIKDVLNLVIESETAAAAARAIARLTDGDAMHCDQFLDLHIKDLVKTRRDQIKARDIGHTDIREAKWNLAHRTCVEGMQDGEVLVELLPPSPSASWAAWVTTCLHEWREHTDWHTFLERYMGSYPEPSFDGDAGALQQ